MNTEKTHKVIVPDDLYECLETGHSYSLSGGERRAMFIPFIYLDNGETDIYGNRILEVHPIPEDTDEEILKALKTLVRDGR